MNELDKIPESVIKLAEKFAQDNNLKITDQKTWNNIFYKKGKGKLEKIVSFIRKTKEHREITEDLLNKYYIDCINFRNSCFKIIMLIEELLGAFLSCYHEDFYKENYLNTKTTLGQLFNDIKKQKILCHYFKDYLGVEQPGFKKIWGNFVDVRNDVCHPKFLGLLEKDFVNKLKLLKHLIPNEFWKSLIKDLKEKQKTEYFVKIIEVL